MAGHRYWRIYVNRNGATSSLFTAIVGLEFQDSGHTDLVGSGTASASSVINPAHNADAAFLAYNGDTDGSNFWQTLSGSAIPSWVKYDFGTDVDVKFVAFTSVRNTDRTPNAFTISYSDDDVVWVPVGLWYSEDGWTLGETRVYDLSDTGPAKLSLATVQPLVDGYSNVLNPLDVVQPIVDGYSNVLNPLDMVQPVVDGYSNVLHPLAMIQAIFPVFPEPTMAELAFPGFGNSVADASIPAALDPFNSALPGLSINVRKKPMFRTNVKEASAGNEVRIAQAQYPRWEFELEYEFLRDVPRATGYTSLHTIQGFFLQMQGSFGAFLYKDPDDYLVASGQCGVADGVTTGFSLMRSLGGFSEIVGQVDDANPIVVSVSIEEVTAIPATPGPYTVTVVNAADFVVDEGVLKGVTPMVKVTGSPAAGQYSVNETTGVYTFNATDESDAITITYSYALATDTGYAIELPNQLVFDSAPADGTIIRASFQFFYACRFLDDEMEFERFMDKLWSLQSCAFKSIIQ